MVEERPGSLTADSVEVGSPADGALSLAGWERYDVVRLLGQGGMGAVYLARDRRLGREVALKFIRGGDPRRTGRLLQEARAQARIAHANVCKVHEVGEVEGRAYIAMELVAGKPLSEAMGELTLHEKVQVIRDVALGLHEAHTQGILHRDVKPANVMIARTDEGRPHPVVMDFGLAREESGERGLTETGAVIGTPGYMPPEQVRGEIRQLDRRSDVYALGATLYELLCGQVPFHAEGTVRSLLQVLDEDPRPPRALAPSVPEDLEIIALKCLAKEPSRRYDSARALAEDLDRYVHGDPIVARKASWGYRVRRRVRRHRALVVVAGLALAAVAAVAIGWLRARAEARRHAAELEERARVAQQLGRELEEMDWYMRTAYGLPLHDIGADEGRLRARIAEIEAEMSGYGAFRRDFAHYALGRGYLGLRRYDEALVHLRQALAGVLDTPELHYALAVVLGKLFKRAMDSARFGGDDTWLAKRRAELVREYLDPALVSIEKSRSLRLGSPSYLGALAASYRGDQDAALELARRAQGEAPWFYEARQFEGDVLYERASALTLRGVTDAADGLFAEAATAYGRAAEIGRSDGELYRGAADAWMERTYIGDTPGMSREKKLAQVFEWARMAIAAAPARGEPYVTLAQANLSLAGALGRMGKSPRPAVDFVIATADRAIQLEPGLFEAYTHRADALVMRTLAELSDGIDPRTTIAAAVASARRAQEVEPRNPNGKQALANALSVGIEYGATVGDDVSTDVQAMIASARECTRIDPTSTMGYVEELLGYKLLAEHLRRHGQSARSVLDPAARAHEACLRTTTRGVVCETVYGMFREVVAEQLHDAGEDFGPTLAAARADLEKGMATGLWPREWAARAALLAAAADRSPASLADLDKALAACFGVAAESAVCTLVDARRALLLANPQRALELATLASSRDRRSSDAVEVLAEVHGRLAVGPQRARHWKAAREVLARGLAQNPHHARLLAALAELDLDEARAGEPGAAGRAREAFERALAENPLLSREHAAGIQEARRRP